MHRNEAHAALRDKISADRAVDAAGEERDGAAVTSHGHAARAGLGLGMDVGRHFAHLEVDGELGVMHFGVRVRIRLGEETTDVLTQLNAREREALIRPLGLDLEGGDGAHIVAEILDRLLCNDVLVLFAGGRARDRGEAEDLLCRLERGVEIGLLVARLHIKRGLAAGDLVLADVLEPPAEVIHQLLFKKALVQTLKEQLAGLEQ